MRNVALVSMPFGPLFSPSLGLSLLKAALTREEIPSRIHYFTVRFAELTTSRFYLGIANGVRPSVRNLAGEWIFSAALFGRDDDDDAYVHTVLHRPFAKTNIRRRGMTPALLRRIVEARAMAKQFVDQCAEEVLCEDPPIVGFTSVFQQQTASLALAKRIKSLRPETFVLFGGANCEGAMGAEVVRQFPFVDAAVSGEGDLVIADLVRRILDGRAIDDVPGVRTHARVAAELAANRFTNTPVVFRMDDLPYPDYSDYFEQFRKSRFNRQWLPRLFFETSRGCWWGEKMHCTFCGLNGTTMQFRSKSADRALPELTELTTRYAGCDVEMTDNILDLAYFKDLIPELARRKIDLGIFYETKANLRKEQVRLLYDAGIRSIQPGIESLSDTVLKLMRKGVSALQNIQLLKWCCELGVLPRWNILWGFPREPAEAYVQMAEIAPLLTHLTPPGSFSTIRLDRFSPNFFDSEALGFANVEPLPAYRFVYRGIAPESIRNLAYHFEFGYREPQDVASYARPLALALTDWQRAAGKSALFSIDTGDHLIIWDLRPIARRALTVLSGMERLVYLGCDAVTDVRQLAGNLASCDVQASVEEIAAILAPMIESGLVIQDGGRVLALAVPFGGRSLSQPVIETFYGVIRGIGEGTSGGIAVAWNGATRRRRAHLLPRKAPRFLSTPQFKVEGPYVLIH